MPCMKKTRIGGFKTFKSTNKFIDKKFKKRPPVGVTKDNTFFIEFPTKRAKDFIIGRNRKAKSAVVGKGKISGEEFFFGKERRKK